MTAPVLAIENLHFAFGEGSALTPILRGVNLVIEPGEVHGLVGESGGGKTMVGKAVAGLLPAGGRITAGAIRFQGQELVTLAPAARRALLGRSIAMILQQPTTALNPVLRIETQIVDVLRRHLGLARAAARARAAELLARVRIRAPERVLRQYPHELSGGMCQRVVIAIAFACAPSLIIADEPTTALDVTVQFQILRLIREMQQGTGAAVLFITHDLGVVAKMCDRVSVIHSGRVLEHATTEALFADPRHPYTRALLAAMPRYDRPEASLNPVPAELIDALWREAHGLDAERARDPRHA